MAGWRVIGRYWLCALAGLVSCAVPETGAPAAASASAAPVRIVSLDFCADQYVLELADRDAILALSPEAEMAHSYLRTKAKGFAQVRPRAEDVLALRPDLIVRSYGGGPRAEAFFEAAGVPVVTVGWASDFDAIRAVTQEVATGLGVPDRGAQLVAEIERRLGALGAHEDGRSVLYMTPTGVTTGGGSLVDHVFEVAGLENFERRAGWHPLPLERLVSEQADLVAASFFNSEALSHDVWSAARHPVARAQLRERAVVALDGAWTACGAWFALDAAEALAQAGGAE